MRKISLIIILLCSLISLKAQEIKFRDNIDKDSLFNIFVQKLPAQIREEYIKIYKNGRENEKDFLLLMISMPRSSKEELITNFENKRSEILTLKNEYKKLVPLNYIVEIEIQPESKILTTNEEYTIKIYTKKTGKESKNNNTIERNDGLQVISQNWNLKLQSKELEKVLKSINWTNQTLTKIKTFLNNANCISIDNNTISTIGYSRSGLGKYYYKIFESAITPEQKSEYNDGCQYIYYKDNIVLEYGGGAIGPQCFESE